MLLKTLRVGFIYWSPVGLCLSCLSALFRKLYFKPVLEVSVEICSCLINAEKVLSISSQIRCPE